MSQHEVTLLLGSNLGNTKENIEMALSIIEKDIGRILRSSEILFTSPVEFVSNNIFRNIAVSLYTNVSPFYLLREIKNIEKEMGRAQDSFAVGGYIDRIIDIDIVLYGDVIIQSKILEIPHKKHLLERDFSKVLLEEIK